VKIFESTREKMSALFTAALDGAADHEGPFFLWAKIHESDFYSLEAPWRPIYYRGGDRSQPLPPPYDLATPPGAQKTEDQQAATRQRYTSAVRWVASHRDRVAPMNLAQVMATVD
jgi:hypothetical protein